MLGLLAIPSIWLVLSAVANHHNQLRDSKVLFLATIAFIVVLTTDEVGEIIADAPFGLEVPLHRAVSLFAGGDEVASNFLDLSRRTRSVFPSTRLFIFLSSGLVALHYITFKSASHLTKKRMLIAEGAVVATFGAAVALQATYYANEDDLRSIRIVLAFMVLNGMYFVLAAPAEVLSRGKGSHLFLILSFIFWAAYLHAVVLVTMDYTLLTFTGDALLMWSLVLASSALIEAIGAGLQRFGVFDDEPEAGNPEFVDPAPSQQSRKRSMSA
jgi:hypothetical protein